MTEPAIAEAAPAEALSFRDVVQDPTVLAALDRVGFKTPTPVQAESLPLSLDGADLILQAKTGSGKTLTFILPLLSILAESTQKSTTLGLILTPTRELASQICEVFHTLTPDVAPVLAIGGLSIGEQIRGLKSDGRVVVGTPGRILDLLRQRELSLKNCEFFAVDEVDEMFSMDFEEDVRAILSRLPRERQGIFVSATISPKVEMLANNFLSNPQKVVISSPGEALPPVEHLVYEVSGDVTAKANALCDLIETFNPRSAIIFCNTKSDTELVQAYLERRGYDAGFLNSDLNQRQRDAIMAQMRAGELRLLVGTDLAARGLDIAELDLVVNYALPDQPEVYVHRTGRTGRAGRSGRAISLIGPQDFMAWVNIQRMAPMPITKQSLPSEEEIAKARVAHLHALLRELEGEVSPKDLQVATQFLKDAGVETPTEELGAAIGKLLTFFIGQSALLHRQKLAARTERASMPSPRDDYNSGSSGGGDHHRRRSGGHSRGGGGSRRGGGGGGRHRR